MRTMVTMMTKMRSLRTIVLKDKGEPTTGGDGLWWSRMSEWFWSTQTSFFCIICLLYPQFLCLWFGQLSHTTFFCVDCLLHITTSSLSLFLENFLLNHPYSSPFILYVFVLVNLVNLLLSSSKSRSKRIMPCHKVSFRSIKNSSWLKKNNVKTIPSVNYAKYWLDHSVWSGLK